VAFPEQIKNQKRRIDMKEIFQEYGGVLITVVAILAVILVVSAVVGSDASGPIGTAFTQMISKFIERANVSIGAVVTTL
jgi:hypothetical protein